MPARVGEAGKQPPDLHGASASTALPLASAAYVPSDYVHHELSYQGAWPGGYYGVIIGDVRRGVYSSYRADLITRPPKKELAAVPVKQEHNVASKSTDYVAEDHARVRRAVAEAALVRSGGARTYLRMPLAIGQPFAAMCDTPTKPFDEIAVVVHRKSKIEQMMTNRPRSRSSRTLSSKFRVSRFVYREG